MKKVIKGRVYDTSTAKKLGEYQLPLGSSNPQFFVESIYQKKTGEFFLYCEGNVSSKARLPRWRIDYDGNEYIRPITFKQAQDWAEEYLGDEGYARIFCPQHEKNGTIMLGLNVSTYAAEKLKHTAMMMGYSQSHVLNQWILEGAKRFEEEERQHEEELKSYTNEELYEMIREHQDYEMVMEFCERAGLGDHPSLCDDEWCWEAIGLAAKKLGVDD